MATPADFETELLRGIAAHLSTESAGYYHATDAYPADVRGIFITEAPSTHPSAITLAAYSVTDDTSGVDTTVGVQVRFREATVAECGNAAGAVFQALQGRWGVVWGTVRISRVFRRSSAPLGPNAEGLYERTDNYYVDAGNPAPGRF